MPNNWPFTPSTPLMARLQKKRVRVSGERFFIPIYVYASLPVVCFFRCELSDLMMKIDVGLLTGMGRRFQNTAGVYFYIVAFFYFMILLIMLLSVKKNVKCYCCTRCNFLFLGIASCMALL